MRTNKNKLESIRQMKDLLEQGIISQDEFNQKKKQILETIESDESKRKVQSANNNSISHPEQSTKLTERVSADNNYMYDREETIESFSTATNINTMYQNHSNTTNGNTKGGVLSRKATNIISYLGIFWLLAYFAGDKNNCTYHLNQGLVLVLFNIALSIVLTILRAIGASCVFTAPAITILISIITFVIAIVDFVFWLLGFIHAIKDEEKPIPVIGNFVLLK